MADIYRFDIQFRAPWPDGPQEFYYWTNIYHASIRDFTDFDLARDYVGSISANMSHYDTRLDRIRVVNLTDGSVVQNSNFSWPANTLLMGDTAGLCNTVFCRVLIAGRVVSYKRFRSPVRLVDMDGDRLTDSAFSYFDARAQAILTPEARFCTPEGDFYDQVETSPFIHGWQLRHGTRRARYRRLHA